MSSHHEKAETATMCNVQCSRAGLMSASTTSSLLKLCEMLVSVVLPSFLLAGPD